MKGQRKKNTQRDQIRRGSRGRFLKGCPSANPSGRPRGIVDRRTRLLRELTRTPALINSVWRKALGGDMTAAKLLLDRLIPSLKAVSEPVTLNVTGKTLTEQAQKVFESATSGTISTDDAQRLIELLMGQVKIKETEDFEKRLAAIEKAIEENGGFPDE